MLTRVTGAIARKRKPGSVKTTPDATDSVSAWWPRHLGAVAGLDAIESAVASGFHADRVGFAFAGGYHAALRRLVPSLDAEHLAALAATEEGGARPSAIRTTLERDGE